MMATFRSEKGRFVLSSGDTVVDPCYVDYGDGVGEQLCGGRLYNGDGTYLGHLDPPGIRGHSGYSGFSGK